MWSQSTGGGRLLEVPNVPNVQMAFTGKVLVFWLDGRLRKVVTHMGWTVQYTHLNQHSELNCNTASAIAQIQTSSSCLSKT